MSNWDEGNRNRDLLDEIESRVNPSQRVASQDKDMSNGDGRNQSRDVKTASIYMRLEIKVIEKLKRMKGDRDWNELMKDLLNGTGEMYVTENGTMQVEFMDEIQINWALRTAPDTNNPKYEVDKKVNEYYMPKLE